MKKILTLAAIVICGLYMNDAKAEIIYPCPAGCFCMGSGNFKPIIQVSSNTEDIVKKECARYSAKANDISSSGSISLCGGHSIAHSDTKNDFEDATYYTNDFSVYYVGSFGFYGLKKDGEFVHLLGDCNDQGKRSYTDSPIYNCPEQYPESDIGSKALTDCFRYNTDGDKVYYGDTEPRIKTKLIDHNGWIPLVSCQPGYYMPANSTKCSSCIGNNACPGGMFYVDKTYTSDRGIIVCENGVNSDRTSCHANGTNTSTTKTTTSTNNTGSSSSTNTNSNSSNNSNSTSSSSTTTTSTSNSGTTTNSSSSSTSTNTTTNTSTSNGSSKTNTTTTQKELDTDTKKKLTDILNKFKIVPVERAAVYDDGRNRGLTPLTGTTQDTINNRQINSRAATVVSESVGGRNARDASRNDTRTESRQIDSGRLAR